MCPVRRGVSSPSATVEIHWRQAGGEAEISCLDVLLLLLQRASCGVGLLPTWDATINPG